MGSRWALPYPYPIFPGVLGRAHSSRAGCDCHGGGGWTGALTLCVVKCLTDPMTRASRRPTATNPATRRRFRRSQWLEIYLPLAGGVLLVAVALTGTVLAAHGGSWSAWADAALLLLVLPALLLGLVLLALLGGLAYGLWWVIRAAPPYFKIVQDGMARLSRATRRAGDRAVAPILGLQAFKAALGTLLRR